MPDIAEIAIGVQTAHGSPPPGSYTALRVTEAAATPQPTVEDLADEMATGSLIPTAAGVRLGVWTPVSLSARARPDMLAHLLRAAGLADVTPLNVSGNTWTQTLIPVEDDGDLPWIGWHVQIGQTTILDRILEDSRIRSLALEIPANAAPRVTVQATAAHEENAAGTEDDRAETQAPLVTVAGSFSLTKSGGGSMIGNLQKLSLTVENEFIGEGDEIPIAGHEMGWITWLGMRIDGSAEAVFSASAWQTLFYGGSASAGSGYSFTDLAGALDVTLESHDTIPGTATARSLQIEIPNLIARGGEVRANGRGEIRIPIVFMAYSDGVDPLIRATLTTDLSDMDRQIAAGSWGGFGATYTARYA